MPIGSFCLSNSSSLNVYEIIHAINDRIIVGVNNQKRKNLRLYCTQKGVYFVFGRKRFYLNDCLRR